MCRNRSAVAAERGRPPPRPAVRRAGARRGRTSGRPARGRAPQAPRPSSAALRAAVLDERPGRRVVAPPAGVLDVEHVVAEPVEPEHVLEVVPEHAAERVRGGQAGDDDPQPRSGVDVERTRRRRPPVGGDGTAGRTAGVQPRVEAACREQLGVRAPLDDLAVVHDEDLVGVADRREAVGDDERRAARASAAPARRGAAASVPASSADWSARPGSGSARPCRNARAIESRCRSPPDRRHAALADHACRSPPGARSMKSCALAASAAAHDLLVGGVRAGRRRCSRAMREREDERLLQDHRDLRAQDRSLSVAQVVAVDGDPARPRVEEPHQQADERRLARAGPADDGDDLARAAPRSEMSSQDGPALVVAERDVLVADAPLDLDVDRASGASVTSGSTRGSRGRGRPRPPPYWRSRPCR